MLRPHIVAALVVLAAGAAVMAGCPDGLIVVETPRIQITVDNDNVPNDNTATSQFPQANQLPVTKDIVVSNPGKAPLTITSIAWKPGRPDGGVFKNQYIEHNLTTSFPIVLPPNGEQPLQFNVTFTPPPDGSGLTDFQPSILVFESDAKDVFGNVPEPAVEVTFQMTILECSPQVNPPNYQFTNATPSSPETQIFTISQDPLATGECSVESVSLQSPSAVYDIIDRPVTGTKVDANTSASFSLRFTPTGNNDATDNAVIVIVSGQTFTVPVSANTQLGGYTLSCSHPDKFDFSAISTGQECRRCIIISEGPGPLRVNEPKLEIEPATAASEFDEVTAYKPATSPGGSETMVTSWPQALAQGRSLEFELCYSPTGGGQSGIGDLVIPIGTPDPGEVKVAVFAGDPKPLLSFAPPNNAINVSADIAGSETGTRRVVLYNTGNADQVIVGATLTGAFVGTDPVVWSITAPTDFSTPIPPGGLMVIDLAYDASLTPVGQTSHQEVLVITYIEGFSGTETTEVMPLNLTDAAGVTLPVADPGTYDPVEAGSEVLLTPAGSDPGAGTFPPQSPYASWYLTSKPAGSRAVLNVDSDDPVPFRPDQPGDYTIEMVVFSSMGGDYIYSVPVTTTITATAAAN